VRLAYTEWLFAAPESFMYPRWSNPGAQQLIAAGRNPKALALNGGTPVGPRPFPDWRLTNELDEQNISSRFAAIAGAHTTRGTSFPSLKTLCEGDTSSARTS